MNLNNLDFDKASKTHRSGRWLISETEAESLVGGWLYLHATKSEKSEFGGVVIGFEPVTHASLARSERIVFVLQSEADGKGQCWRGRRDANAHSSGVVDADLPHEVETNKA